MGWQQNSCKGGNCKQRLLRSNFLFCEKLKKKRDFSIVSPLIEEIALNLESALHTRGKMYHLSCTIFPDLLPCLVTYSAVVYG